ncbi:SRPBCC family protein [Oceanicella actignis]|uniref:SRPBCC family protein n=1 Tax=Oceanicella actignis TaxID=1189325 RepID=UPI0011E66526|nr:SRPBCC family protein [Oceanicella actignis]TYO89561.1 polyketide cyclase/dehydrase/lipid transport protein [Oceanicella actignis]
MSDREPRDRVERWVDLDADAQRVWAAVGGFGAIADWHPLVESCELVELDGDLHRHLRLADGALMLERLVDQGPHHYRYEIVEGPLPVEDYLSTFTVFARGKGCRVFWSASFEPAIPDAEEADRVVAAVYEAGLAAIRDRFSA